MLSVIKIHKELDFFSFLIIFAVYGFFETPFVLWILAFTTDDKTSKYGRIKCRTKKVPLIVQGFLLKQLFSILGLVFFSYMLFALSKSSMSFCLISEIIHPRVNNFDIKQKSA